MKIRYEKWTPRANAVAMLREADAIATDYARQGYNLTLRQLYYQFVARALIPNNQKSYDQLGQIVNKGRLAGYLDWNHIVDRTRNLSSLTHFRTPAHAMESLAGWYGEDLWNNQPTRVEVWVEKEALAGVVQRAAESMDCAWFSCRGYVSQSEMWAASQRIGRYMRSGQNVTILHLGDHDPSGIDMTRDIRDRLQMFIASDAFRRGEIADVTSIRGILALLPRFQVQRIALNRDQVDEYNPPPNPAKLSDSRAQAYVAEHGYESWELDALDPATLDALIREHIAENVDMELFNNRTNDVENQREHIVAASDNWSDVVDFLGQNGWI